MSSPRPLTPRSYTLSLRRPSSVMNSTTVPLPGPSSKVTALPNHSRDLALHKYLLLQEEHNHLRQHLDSLLPLQNPAIGTRSDSMGQPASATSTLTTSAASSSSSSTSTRTTPYQSSGSSIPRSCGQVAHRRSSLPPVALRSALCVVSGTALETVIDESTIAELASEEARLCNINESIKRVLTELLNCDAVRGDRALRTWVQCRLMDTEKELRSGRRRRSAPEPCTTEFP